MLLIRGEKKEWKLRILLHCAIYHDAFDSDLGSRRLNSHCIFRFGAMRLSWYYAYLGLIARQKLVNSSYSQPQFFKVSGVDLRDL